jgi:hypothetical protein
MVNFISLIRTILRVPKPAITSEYALEIAREECRKRGWPWVDPVVVTEELRSWRIWTNAEHLGGNVIIRINSLNGSVEHASLTPR